MGYEYTIFILTFGITKKVYLWVFVPLHRDDLFGLVPK